MHIVILRVLLYTESLYTYTQRNDLAAAAIRVWSATLLRNSRQIFCIGKVKVKWTLSVVTLDICRRK